MNRKMRRPPRIALMLAAVAFSTLAPVRGAGAPADSTSHPDSTRPAQTAAPAPVVFGHDTLFTIQTRLGPFSPADRARSVQERMARFADDPLVKFDSVAVYASETSSDLIAGNVLLLSVTDADARAAGQARQALAQARARAIAQAMRSESFWASAKIIVLGALLAFLATGVLFLIAKVLGQVLRRVQRLILGWKGTGLLLRGVPDAQIQRSRCTFCDTGSVQIRLSPANRYRIVKSSGLSQYSAANVTISEPAATDWSPPFPVPAQGKTRNGTPR